MALIQNNGGQGGRFLKILDGSIVERSKTEQPGYEKYSTTNPSNGQAVEYFIKRYSAIEGNFARLERKEIPEHQIFGYNLTLTDEDGEFTLFLKDRARTTNRFLKLFENLDLKAPIRIDVWKDRDGNTAITFKQNGQNISQFWNKENLPEPEEVMGKWDYSAQDKHLYKHFRDNVIPNLPAQAKAAGAGAGGGSSDGDDEPIPF